jgi:hypothetical protein
MPAQLHALKKRAPSCTCRSSRKETAAHRQLHLEAAAASLAGDPFCQPHQPRVRKASKVHSDLALLLLQAHATLLLQRLPVRLLPIRLLHRQSAGRPTIHRPAPSVKQSVRKHALAAAQWQQQLLCSQSLQEPNQRCSRHASATHAMLLSVGESTRTWPSPCTSA